VNMSQARCPYCETPLEKIRLLHPTTPDVFNNGIQQFGLTGGSPENGPDSAQARSPGLGEVRGMICRSCWRLL
jgi:hypothetical protein